MHIQQSLDPQTWHCKSLLQLLVRLLWQVSILRVQAQHTGRFIIPKTHNRNHSDVLLLATKLVRDRIDCCDPSNVGVRVLDDLSLLYVGRRVPQRAAVAVMN